MRRREVIGGLSLAGMAWPLGLGAQPTGKPIFGILLVFSSESGKTFTDPIRAYLAAVGFVDGRNIELDFRHADGNVGRLPMMATELVARRPAVIATFWGRDGTCRSRSDYRYSHRGNVRGFGASEARQGYAASWCEHYR